MKVILSRKGFDSANGTIPSPILPDGKLLSLPIPSNDDIHYSQLKYPDLENYLNILESLTKNKRNKLNFTTCHLDPDIYPNIIKRKNGWKPLFGQSGASAKHLLNNNIGSNDLFLFFGWFKNTKMLNNNLVFDKERKFSLHVIFGYFQIDNIITSNKYIEDWMKYHPHVKRGALSENNILIVAKKNLSFNKKLPGAFPFKYINNSLILTKKINGESYMSRSRWYFNKDTFGRKIYISYHKKSDWKNNYFQSASIGQEFIMENELKVSQWAKNMVRNA